MCPLISLAPLHGHHATGPIAVLPGDSSIFVSRAGGPEIAKRMRLGLVTHVLIPDVACHCWIK